LNPIIPVAPYFRGDPRYIDLGREERSKDYRPSTQPESNLDIGGSLVKKTATKKTAAKKTVAQKSAATKRRRSQKEIEKIREEIRDQLKDLQLGLRNLKKAIEGLEHDPHTGRH
jgi:hypothetical protein